MGMILMSNGEAATADDILSALVASAGDCIWCTELAFSGGKRRADFWKLEPHLSKGYRAVAYEIKVSRADFKRDSHAKQREARTFSDQFFYATPPGLLKPGEVPDWAGLVEVHGGAIKVIVPAVVRDKDAPSWELVISLIRNSGTIRRDRSLLEKELTGLRRQVADAKAKLKAEGIEPWRFGLW